MHWDCLGRFEPGGEEGCGCVAESGLCYVPGWKSQFWAINGSSQERERAGRWGGGRGWEYRGDYQEETSDTGNENDDDDDNEEEDLGENEGGVTGGDG